MGKLDRIISFWGISSGGNPDVRFTQFINSKTGWRGFVNQPDFKKQLDAGVRRFLIHMPFGREKDVRQQLVNGQKFDTFYRFDAYQQAVAANLPWLTTGFAEEFKALVDNGCQVIAYMGTLAGSPEFEVASGIARRQWLDGSIEPTEDAGCDYAIDTACRAPSGHYCTNIVDAMRRKGTRVYCESMPRIEADHWCKGDVISSETQYQAAVGDVKRVALCDPSKIVGELVRGLWDPAPQPFKNYADYYKAVVPEVLKAGHTACLQLRHYLNQGGKLEELAP